MKIVLLHTERRLAIFYAWGYTHCFHFIDQSSRQWLKAARQTVAVPQGWTWPPSSLATIVEPIYIYIYIHEGCSESKERFAIQRYFLIIGKKQNMQVLSHTFTYFST